MGHIGIRLDLLHISRKTVFEVQSFVVTAAMKVVVTSGFGITFTTRRYKVYRSEL